MFITLKYRSTLTFLLALSCSCTTALGAMQKVDNTSPVIQYQGSWTPFNTPGDGDVEDTLEFSQDNLDSAILHFTGTSVAVFGALKPVGTWNMHSAYYLDGSPAAGFTPNPQVDSEQHQVQFYSSGSLSDGSHTLTIVNMGQQFWFDFIALETSDLTTATVTGTAPTLPPGIMTLPISTSSTLPTTSSTNPVQTTSPVRPQPTSTSTSPITSVTSTLANQFVPAHATPPSTSSLLGTSTVSPNSTGTVSSHTENSTSTSTSTQSNSTPAPPNPPEDPSSSAATSSLPSLSVSTETATSPTASTGAASGGHTLPLGEIIGIAVGGTALILALASLAFALWRRRQRMAARATISPFIREHEDGVSLDGTPPPPPPDYWTSEKRSIVDRARLSLPLQVPGRQMLVITHGDHPGGVWADYQSSMPSASGYHEPESSGGGDAKAFREYVARHGRRSAAVGGVGAKRGTPF